MNMGGEQAGAEEGWVTGGGVSEEGRFEDWMEEMMIHRQGGEWRNHAADAYCGVSDGGGVGWSDGFVWECYLSVREGATQGRGAGGGEAHSPPLLLQRPGQLFKLHLLLPD